MRVWKIILLSFLGLTLVISAVAYVYLFKQNGLERIVAGQVNKLLGATGPVKVEIGHIEGDVFHGISLHDVTLSWADSANAFPIARVRHLGVGYSFANIWNEKWVLAHLAVDSAVILLRVDSAGNVYPHLAKKAPDGGPGQPRELPYMAINSLLLSNLTLVVERPHDTLVIDSLSAVASVQIEGNTYSINLQQLSLVSPLLPQRLTNLSAQITYAGKQITVKNLALQSGATAIKADGIFNLGARSGHVETSLRGIDLSQLKQYGGPSLSGTVNLTGSLDLDSTGLGGEATLAGSLQIASFDNLYTKFRLGFASRRLEMDTLYGSVLGGCLVDGRGQIDFSGPMEKYGLQAKISNFNLEHLVHNSFMSNLNGNFTLAGESFRTKTLKLNLSTELYESSFDQYPIQAAAGDLLITADSISFLDAFEVSYYENHFTATGRIDYRNGIALAVDADLPRLSYYQDMYFIKRPAGRLRANVHFVGETKDPDLVATASSDSLWINDIFTTNADASLSIEHFFKNRNGTVNVRFLNGAAWGIPYDTMSSSFAVDTGNVQLDTVFVHGAYGAVSANGDVAIGGDTIQARLDSVWVTLFDRKFVNMAPVTFGLDDSSLILQNVEIGAQGSKYSTRGKAGYDGSLGLTLEARHILMSPWLHMAKEAVDYDGDLSCRIGVAGTMSAPKISVQAEVDSLTFKELELGNLTILAHYQDRMMRIDSMVVLSDPGIYRVDGTFHTDLSFGNGVVERLPNEPMDLHLVATDSRFDLVSLLLPSVEDMQGKLTSDVRLSGTPREPHLEGQALLKEGRLKYFDIADTVFTDSALVTMHDNQIVISKVEVWVKDKHRREGKSYAYIEGALTVKTLDSLYYDVDVSLPKEFPFNYELEDISGAAEGDLHIEGMTPPTVSGDLLVTSARYEVEFAKVNEGSPIMSLLFADKSWDLNLNIDILSNYWIKNEDIDAEFAGSINMVRENGTYRFAGEMEILRGKGFLFDKTFRLEPDSRVIFEDIEQLNPRLDIIAYTRVPGARRTDNTPTEELELGVHVTGTLELPEINPVEGSSFSQEDILPLIVANYYSSDTATARSGIEQRVTDLVSSQVSQIGTRQLNRIGVETFEIDPTYGGEFDPKRTQVTLGFYTAPRLYVFGRSPVDFRSGTQEVGFEYRIDKGLLLEGRRDELELYHVNLRWHLEF